MDRVNWGIIGLGNIAQSFSDGFFGIKNSNLLAIASLNSSKLEKFKSKFKIDSKFVFNNYEKLIDCKEVDIIYITLPNSFHYEWIIECIKKNKRILVEKPAFINFEDAKNIKRKIEQKKLFFSEGFTYRYHPQTIEILKIINNNEIGKIISMETSFGSNLLTKKKLFFFNKKKKINPDSRLFNKKLGGGCILDLGCYPSSFSLLIASQLKDINYRKFQIIDVKKEEGETGVEIDSEAVLKFEGGFYSRIKASFKKDLGNQSIIYGDKGSLIICNTWHGDRIKKIIGKKNFVINKYYKKNIFSYEIEDISKTILMGSNQTSFPGMTLEQTLLNSKILEDWISV
jgi:predicted dehydrogenase